MKLRIDSEIPPGITLLAGFLTEFHSELHRHGFAANFPDIYFLTKQ
jgi:hypothetical protein